MDVTEHKQAQRELQQSETRFRELAQREALLNRMVNQIRNSLDIDTIVETALHEVRNLLSPRIQEAISNIDLEFLVEDFQKLRDRNHSEFFESGSHSC